jgi:hypothetical protein
MLDDSPPPSGGGEGEQLLIWADGEPDDGAPPLAVTFTVDPLEDIDSPEYTWEFGDGSDTVEGAEVQHTYQRAGIFKARVRVRDANGNVGDDTVQIHVEAEGK